MSDLQHHINGSTETTTKIEGSQEDYELPKKRSWSNSAKSVSNAVAKRRLEARRRSNRLSAAKARLRYKSTVNELQQGQVALRSTNQKLASMLQKVRSENLTIRNFLENEHKVAMKRNALIQRELERRIEEKQSAIQKVGRELNRTVSPLEQLASIASHVPYE